MSTQNYCMINQANSVCENICLWDGDPNTWQPPANYLMLVQATTPAKNWIWDSTAKQWNLEVYGFGQVGFTWDGTYLTSNEPEPPIPVQPAVEGAQTL